MTKICDEEGEEGTKRKILIKQLSNHMHKTGKLTQIHD
jgi:hypothetical protein